MLGGMLSSAVSVQGYVPTSTGAQRRASLSKTKIRIRPYFASGHIRHPRARGFNLCASLRICSHMWPIEEFPTSRPCDTHHEGTRIWGLSVHYRVDAHRVCRNPSRLPGNSSGTRRKRSGSADVTTGARTRADLSWSRRSGHRRGVWSAWRWLQATADRRVFGPGPG